MMWIVLLAGCLVDEALYREVRASFRDVDGDDVTPREGDCDDENDQIAPGVAELCDGVDNDCDGVVDEDPKDQFWYADDDGDGFGSSLDFKQQCESPGDGYTIDPGDCDDANGEIHPGATEMCDASDVDEDCDGTADNGDADAVGRRDWYADADGDDFGDPVDVQTLCDQPAGYADNAEDCDDADGEVWPGQVEVCNGKDDDCDAGVDLDPTDGVVYFADDDADGFGDALAFVVSCVEVGGHVIDGTDCDDADASVNPVQVEICDPDQRDEDCDTFVDDGDTSATGQDVFFGDADGDGHGVAGAYVVTCDPPIGYGVGTDDCDDADATRYPGAVEVCDTIDSDCDGSVDDGDAVDAAPWYTDADGDGYGTSTLVGYACAQPSGAAANSADCDDMRSDTWPGATETCDEADNDCNGLADDGAAAESVWYTDLDGDGFGAEARAGCPTDAGYVVDGGDCDDADPDVSPGAQEICSDAEVDEDCDGRVDDGDASVMGASAWYTDADGDGHGDAATALVACRGEVAVGDDCDDTNALVAPGQYEVCNGVDDDCDGTVDVGDPGCAATGVTAYVDADGDGFGAGAPVLVSELGAGYAETAGDCDDADAAVNPGVAEVCRNGLDDDCSGDDNDCLREGDYTTVDADAWFDAPEQTFPDGSVGYADYRAFAWPGVDLDGDGGDDVWAGGAEGGLAASMYTLFRGFPATTTDTGTSIESPTAPTDMYSAELSAGHDATGDGTPDIVIPWQERDFRGAAAVYSWDVATGDGNVPAAVAWGLTTAVINGHKSAFEGDIDGDGIDDLAFVSSIYAESTAILGNLTLWRGPVAGELYPADAYASLTGTSGDGGIQAATACDVDGDGVDNAFWSQTEWTGAVTRQGRVVGFNGFMPGGAAFGDTDIEWVGTDVDDQAGSALTCLRGIRGDGTPDLYVTAPNDGGTSSPLGKAFVVTDTAVISGPIEDAAWTVVEGSGAGEDFGAAGKDGDFDGDGQIDLVVGAPSVNHTATGSGALYVFYRATSGVLDPASADVVVAGDSAGEGLGAELAFADIDGDGDDDLLLTAAGPGAWTAASARAWLFEGGTR